MPLSCRHPNELAKLAAAYFAAPVLRPYACDRVPPHLERPAWVVEDTLCPPDGLIHGDRLAFDRIGDPTRQAVDGLGMQCPHAPDCSGVREPARQGNGFRVANLVEPEVAERAGQRIGLACLERLHGRGPPGAPGGHRAPDHLKPVLDDGAAVDVRALIAECPTHIKGLDLV